MLAYSAAMGAVYTVGGVVSEALFLSHQPVSATPFLFIFPAFLAVLILLSYNRLVARVRHTLLAVAVPLILACAALLFRLLLALPVGKDGAVLAALYICWNSGCILILIQFWTIAGQVFDTREARRLFSFIAVGATLASVACGLMLAAFGHLISPENVLFVLAVVFVLCGICPLAIDRLHVATASSLGRHAGETVPARISLRRDLIDTWQVPLLRANALLNVVLAALVNVGAFQFFQALQHQFAGRSAAMVVYLGGFNFWTNIAALAVQLGVTGILMRRFGASTALIAYPLAAGIAASASLLAGGALWTMALIRSSALVLASTVSEVGLNALFLPFPAGQGERAKPLMEAIYALTFGLLGFVFLFTGRIPGWTYLYWSPLVLALVAVNVALATWTRRQYAATLAANVNQRRLDFSQVRIDIADDDAVRVLVHSLHDADELRVVHAMWLIADSPSVVWQEHVIALLAHPSVDVRMLALNFLGRARSSASTQNVSALLSAPEDSVRATALGAFCAIAGTSETARIAAFVEDPSPDVRAVAIAYLIRHGREQEQVALEDTLQSMLASEELAIRRAGVTALAELVAPTFESESTAIADRSNEAHRIATLVAMIGDRGCAAVADDGLVRLGSAALPYLEAALADPARDRVLREHIPGILRRIGGGHAAELLLRHLQEPDEMIRAMILDALALLSKAHDVTASSAEALQAAMRAELRHGYALRVIQKDLQAVAEGSLLHDALEERAQQTLDRFFSLLEARYPTASITRARQALRATDDGMRQMAVELFDTILDTQLRDTLIPLLDAPEERVLEIARRRFDLTPRSAEDRLLELASSADSWLRACAIYQIGVRDLHSCTPVVVEALDSSDPVVSEVALMVCRMMVEPGTLKVIASVQAESSGFASVRAYARSIMRDVELA
jgi:HEAT repeat protein